ATIGDDAGQLLNMVFGNTSLHEDVVLWDVVLPEAMEAAFGGPGQGIGGLRRRVGAKGRAMTCSALKPQGLGPERLAALAERFARGRIDFIKDDHGIAEQDYAPFAARVPAIAEAVRRGARAGGHEVRYVPSLSGDLDRMRRQVRIAHEEGVDAVMIAPMIAGVATLQALRREWPEMAFFAHPTLGGAARIDPALLIGRIFRLFGADAVIFPNFGGRFGYSPQLCRRLAGNARAENARLRASVPVPAGGMTVERVPEILDFYGRDAMLLLGGSLLAAGENLTAATLAFTEAVARHGWMVAR
ncbi:MAG TPA: RuBisCO large subunit C-terminal-like domain-containing protein, partial [Acetobacteraceae bacterium]|nr:RuBisCO large subunit C-terminal-like domain-containing protein [Acetobacteraceae bacterium]